MHTSMNVTQYLDIENALAASVYRAKSDIEIDCLISIWRALDQFWRALPWGQR